MPSYVRQVDFDPTPVYSRQPHDDELYVMRAFSRHASHCASCEHPYEVYRRGRTLCPKGHQRAVDVAQYVYNKAGQAYSLVDREGNQRVQIEIPVKCEPVRELLQAMERGLRLMRKAPAVSYDKNYPVAPRQVRPEYRPKPQIIQCEPRRQERYETELPLWYKQPKRQRSPYADKGSLYEQDMMERERRYRQERPGYYSTAPKRAPPVPPKDLYWV